MDCIIRGGTLVTATGSERADVGIVDGRVAAVGHDLGEATSQIDATGCLVLPGAIDVHTHFHHWVEYVGSHNADDFESGTRAAAAGGITSIINYAFQEDGGSLRSAIDRDAELGATGSHIDFGLHPVVTKLTDGVLAELSGLAADGFTSLKVFTAVAGFRLPDEDLLAVMAEAGRNGMLLNVHAEDDPLIQFLTRANEREGRTSVSFLPDGRPSIAERIATQKVAAYASFLGVPVYFVHLSTSGAMQAVREARTAGAEIYVETRPVYLFLDRTLYDLPDALGNKYVCLPPLRTPQDSEALWSALGANEIQTYATDHAPWSEAQKLDASRPYWRIPAGVSNLQTSVPMLYSEGVAKGRISACQFVAATSTNPAKLFGLYPQKGAIQPGSDADIVVFDPEARITIRAAEMESNADYDPYDGYECTGWPRVVMSRGEVIVRDRAVLSEPGRGRLLRRAPYQPA